MKFSLIPREVQFFDMIEDGSRLLVDGAAALLELSSNFDDMDEKIKRINDIEHACDDVSHHTLEKLETSFITPLDREDIHELVLHMDDVIDMIAAVATRFGMFHLKQPRKTLAEFADVISQQTKALSSALSQLRNPKKYDLVRKDCIEVHRLENQADEIFRRAIRELFENETNAIDLIRWKEVYEVMETVTDCGEDVANIIHGIVVKQG